MGDAALPILNYMKLNGRYMLLPSKHITLKVYQQYSNDKEWQLTTQKTLLYFTYTNLPNESSLWHTR